MNNHYAIPDGLRVYAIGDVHGALDKLKAMHELISTDLLGSPVDRVHIVYLGDYVDRGPDSKGVIDYLIARRDRGDGIAKSFIKGNHEIGMLNFLRGDPDGDDWLDFGGIETMRSYGVDVPDVMLPAERERAPELLATKIPDEHIEFMDSLELYVEIGDYVFCHAGLMPHVPMDQQSVFNLTFMRQPFLSYYQQDDYKPLPKKVVHGHSVSKTPIERPHRVGLDTGVYMDGGKLTCGVFEDKDVRFLQV